MNNNDLLPKGEDIVEQARRYADEGRWDEAIETYKKALEKNPTDADLYNDLGIAFDEAGKLTEAEQAYQKATELDPQFSAAFYNLGLMYEEQSRLPEAVEAYQKCIKYSKKPTECSAAREKLIALTSDTPTGQSSLAYRIAACLLILGVLMNIVGLLVVRTTLSTPIVISGVVDFILVIGLFKLRTWARNLTYGRAFLGAIVVPIWYFLVVFKANIWLTLLVSVVQWGYCGSLILLLTGQSKTWRLVSGVIIFLVFVLGLYILSLLFYVFARTM
jgi:tetratricopeptide (TPR) repeat protein